jgi:aryl-alcohol dehydrogenase-like predicted oxidoreductase
MALAFCYQKWQVTSTIIGVTSIAQLDDNINALAVTLPADLLQKIDALRWEERDPAI